jgi:hypothetical protein
MTLLTIEGSSMQMTTLYTRVITRPNQHFFPAALLRFNPATFVHLPLFSRQGGVFFNTSSPAMATSLIPALTVLGIWLWLAAATKSHSAWAMQTRSWVDAKFHTRRFHVEVDRRASAKYCSPRDISITQRQVSARRIPSFEVSIANTCVERGCSIRSIVAFCGQFTSATFIDPKVFRRDGAGPYCIVNNLDPMASGQMLTFHYDSELMEPIRLSSAQPTCS